MRKYKVYSAGVVVGQTEVERRGLYYYIKCSCKFDKDGIYKVLVSGEEGTVNLGTCIPKVNGYFLEKKISVRSVGSSGLSFRIAEDEKTIDCGIVICEDKPFEWIDRLEECILVKQGVMLRVRLKERAPAPQGNGQIQECEDGSENR